MNKKILYSLMLSMLMIFSGINNCFAEDSEIKENINHQETNMEKQLQRNSQFPKYTKKEIQAKKAEFEKRLNLSEQQKKQIEQNRIKDREKIKPILEKIRQNKIELKKLKEDTSLSNIERVQKQNAIKREIRSLETKADKYRLENMKNFEKILTEEQKAEFEKIKAEQKAKYQERKKQFQQKKDLNIQKIE